jgi:hypothetical protein
VTLIHLSEREDLPLEWEPGDPCDSCGSTDTGWAPDTGAFCNGCGATDADA